MSAKNFDQPDCPITTIDTAEIYGLYEVEEQLGAASTCWDSDRLDLGRVMIRPNTKFLGTEFAKRPDTLE
jgi:predicted oxidoreductase